MPTRKGMRDGERPRVEVALFRVAEFSDALDWRPMLFQEPIIAQRACALCGVVYKKAVRLPCVHTLCVKCHAKCVDGGSVCPVDQESFCKDDVERLEVSAEFILKRKVACWNAPRGCSFIGPAASLLEHYKECSLCFIPCCLCGLSVLQCNILEHYKNGCSIQQAVREPSNDHTTQDLSDVGGACFEMKEALGKLSGDVISLQTDLNRCSEDVRAEVARCKGQCEAAASRLTELLNNLSTVCTTGFAEERQAFQAKIDNYKEHVNKESCSRLDRWIAVLNRASESLLSHPRSVRVHWYVEHWAELTKYVGLQGFKSYSPMRSMFGYSVSQCIELKRVDDEVHFGCFMCIVPGEKDSELEWPFCKVYTVGVTHPKNKSNVISHKIDPSNVEDQQGYCRPMEQKNLRRGKGDLSTVEDLECAGFIENNTLHVFLEMEP